MGLEEKTASADDLSPAKHDREAECRTQSVLPSASSPTSCGVTSTELPISPLSGDSRQADLQEIPPEQPEQAWGRCRPLAFSGEQVPDAFDWQLPMLQKARSLVSELQSVVEGADSKKADVVSFDLCPSGGKGCRVEAKLVFPDSCSLLFDEEFHDVPLSMFEACAMHEELDLIELPYLESARKEFQFAVNAFAMRLKGRVPVIPGVDDVHCCVAFDLLDDPEECLLFYYWSPAEGAKSYRGWSVPPVERGRNRGRIEGMTILLRQSAKPG